jgi:hypothetical protein
MNLFRIVEPGGYWKAFYLHFPGLSLIWSDKNLLGLNVAEIKFPSRAVDLNLLYLTITAQWYFHPSLHIKPCGLYCPGYPFPPFFYDLGRLMNGVEDIPYDKLENAPLLMPN